MENVTFELYRHLNHCFILTEDATPKAYVTSAGRLPRRRGFFSRGFCVRSPHTGITCMCVTASKMLVRLGGRFITAARPDGS